MHTKIKKKTSFREKGHLLGCKLGYYRRKPRFAYLREDFVRRNATPVNRKTGKTNKILIMEQKEKSIICLEMKKRS